MKQNAATRDPATRAHVRLVEPLSADAGAGIDGRLVSRGAAEAVAQPARRVTRAEMRRRRTVALGLVLAAVLGLAIAAQALLSHPPAGPLANVGGVGGAEPAAAQVWVVRPGDTLWTIALAVGGKGDIRPLVDRLSAEVDNRPLQPGERIEIP